MTDKVILITGAAGYLGCMLVYYLLPYLPKKLILIDSGDQGGGFQLARYHDRIRVFMGRIGTIPAHKLRKLPTADIVIHLAGHRLDDYICDKERSRSVDIQATDDVLRYCRLHDIPLIFASSCSVYSGLPEDIIGQESIADLMPTSDYAWSKLEQEEEIFKAKRGCVLRFGTIWGPSPNIRTDTLINNMVQCAINHEFIDIFSPLQIRPYLHILDACSAIVHVIQAQLIGIYNVVSETRTKQSVIDAIKIYYPKFRYKITNKDDKRGSYQASLDRIVSTGWYPIRHIQHAVPEIMPWLR